MSEPETDPETRPERPRPPDSSAIAADAAESASATGPFVTAALVVATPVAFHAVLQLLPNSPGRLFVLAVLATSAVLGVVTGWRKHERVRAGHREGRDWPLIGAWCALALSLVLISPWAWAFSANSVAAVASLRNLARAQERFRESGKCDVDGDGKGEYGYLRELSAAIPVRAASGAPPSGRRILAPALLSGAFRTLHANGAVSRAGYFIRVFLPDEHGRGVGEVDPTQLAASTSDTGPEDAATRAANSARAAPAAVDADHAEQVWCAYAWPVNYGTSGNQTIFVNQLGQITAADNPRYSGRDGCPEPGAAFVSGGAAVITGPAAIHVAGQDGHIWGDFISPYDNSPAGSGAELTLAASAAFLLARGVVAIACAVLLRPRRRD